MVYHPFVSSNIGLGSSLIALFHYNPIVDPQSIILCFDLDYML